MHSMFTTPTQEEINAAMRRLGAAGWLISSTQVSTKGTLKLTPEGQEKMIVLGRLLAELLVQGKIPVGEFSAIAMLALKDFEEASLRNI